MYRSQHSVTGPMKKYTLSEQTKLASKTVRKVRAFLHGASRFEAREFGISDGEMVERGGTVLKGGELQVGERYFVRWDYQGEAGDDFWKFRGDGGQVDSICMMEESMTDDPSIGMPGNLLQMAASDWAQNFYDMAANYEGFGSVLRPQAPQPQRQYDPEDEDYDEEDDYPVNYHPKVAGKWDAIFARVKADEHDIECMFFHTQQGCLAPAGACPFKHTPLHQHTFCGGGPPEAYMGEYSFYPFIPGGYY